jgi:hypothetical protein
MIVNIAAALFVVLVVINVAIWIGNAIGEATEKITTDACVLWGIFALVPLLAWGASYIPR